MVFRNRIIAAMLTAGLVFAPALSAFSEADLIDDGSVENEFESESDYDIIELEDDELEDDKDVTEIEEPEASPAPEPARGPRIADVKESKVYGLEEPFWLKKGETYGFAVEGAGADNVDPDEGDTRWVPEYWKLSTGTSEHKTWQFTAAQDVADGREIVIHIYLIEQEFSDGEWRATGTKNYIEAVIKTVAVDPSPTPTPDATPTPQATPTPDATTTTLTATPDGLGSVMLGWKAVPGADGYIVLGLNKTRTGRQIGYTAKTSWKDTDADSEGWNYYWVMPFYRSSDGRNVLGELSNYVYAIGRTLESVKRVNVKSSDEGIGLTWEKVPNANGYVVLSKTGSNQAAFDPPVTAREAVYLDESAVPGQVNYYWVYATYSDEDGRILVAGPVSPYAWGIR